jgi:glycosyltransferase involved in cell wall biosynthesis
MNNFSIVTPSFNQGQFLEDTIKSVISQEGNFFIDYIIADGGSTDDSVRIIKKYDELLKSGGFPIKCKGVKYRWWSRKDGGQSAAINEGFKLATGDIYAWINSDDYYLDGVFEKIAELFGNKQLEFIHGDAVKIDLTKSGSSSSSHKKSFDGNYKNLTDEDFILQSSTFFRNNILFSCGLLDESLHLVMDHDLWLKMWTKLKKEQILYVPQALSAYRVWANAKTYSLLEQAGKERSLLDKRYDLKFINSSIIYNPYTGPFFYFLRDHFPFLLKVIKKPINFLNNRKRYGNEKSANIE